MNLSYEVKLLNLLSIDDVVSQLEKLGFEVNVERPTVVSATINFSYPKELSFNEVLLVGSIIGHVEATRYV
jgi:hypothetical protein